MISNDPFSKISLLFGCAVVPSNIPTFKDINTIEYVNGNDKQPKVITETVMFLEQNDKR